VLVVLDEPNACLDEAGDAALAAAIVSAKARGTTFVIVTQRTSVLGLADKVLALQNGRMQAVGSARRSPDGADPTRRPPAPPPAAAKPPGP
jgi:ATP-binding cassette subfamily C exporter for protease/lipase